MNFMLKGKVLAAYNEFDLLCFNFVLISQNEL